MKNQRGYLQISFAWLFAIIVGAIILFLAIFLTTKIIDVGQTTQDAKTGKEIGTLLNPLETSFESGKTASFILPVETRIHNKCNQVGEFGRQIIQISQMSFNKWSESDIDVGFSNKYIFSERIEEGKKFYVFSKPFKFPFKVTDLVYLTSAKKKFCFINPPEKIGNELSLLNPGNFFVNNCTNLQAEEVVKVCFSGGSNCDIKVDYGEQGLVTKNGGTLRFSGDALMYGAIFAENDLYECQVQRTMKRVRNLALIYKDKAVFVQKSDCNTNLNSELISLGNLADSLESSTSLGSLGRVVNDLESKNRLANCKLW